jgi:hypothetical protein
MLVSNEGRRIPEDNLVQASMSQGHFTISSPQKKNPDGTPNTDLKTIKHKKKVCSKPLDAPNLQMDAGLSSLAQTYQSQKE